LLIYALQAMQLWEVQQMELVAALLTADMIWPQPQHALAVKACIVTISNSGLLKAHLMKHGATTVKIKQHI
jgi:hypothetical protein